MPATSQQIVKELSPRQSKPWQQIVEERIKAKTKIKSKVSHMAKRCTIICNFGRGLAKKGKQCWTPLALCAAIFSFPSCHSLTAGSTPWTSLVGTGKTTPLTTPTNDAANSFLLGQLLHTLGVVLHSAMHCPTVLVMSSTLLEFTWALKYHSDMWVSEWVRERERERERERKDNYSR